VSLRAEIRDGKEFPGVVKACAQDLPKTIGLNEEGLVISAEQRSDSSAGV
jgi:hypothetical protein